MCSGGTQTTRRAEAPPGGGEGKERGARARPRLQPGAPGRAGARHRRVAGWAMFMSRGPDADADMSIERAARTFPARLKSYPLPFCALFGRRDRGRARKRDAQTLPAPRARASPRWTASGARRRHGRPGRPRSGGGAGIHGHGANVRAHIGDRWASCELGVTPPPPPVRSTPARPPQEVEGAAGAPEEDPAQGAPPEPTERADAGKGKDADESSVEEVRGFPKAQRRKRGARAARRQGRTLPSC